MRVRIDKSKLGPPTRGESHIGEAAKTNHRSQKERHVLALGHLPSGPLTIQENGTPNQAFGTIGFAAGALGALNLSTLTLVGDDADKFGLTSPTLGPDGTFAVNIFAKQPFDFENAAQRNFDVALQAALLGSILGSAITLVSDPISVTVTDANDNAPNGA